MWCSLTQTGIMITSGQYVLNFNYITEIILTGRGVPYVESVHSFLVTDFAARRISPVTHVTRTVGLLVEDKPPEQSVPVTLVIFYWIN